MIPSCLDTFTITLAAKLAFSGPHPTKSVHVRCEQAYPDPLITSRPPKTPSQPPIPTTSLPTNRPSTTTSKSLPSRATLLKRAPWLLEHLTNDLFACGERLTDRERRLVFTASNHPIAYDAETGACKKSKKALDWEASTGWERDLVPAALKCSADLATVEDTWRYGMYFCGFGTINEGVEGKCL
jgi:hypothetical protein